MRSMKRRSKHHDYYAPSIYHITMCKAAETVPFGSLVVGDAPSNARVEHSALGSIIADEIRAWPRFHPEIKVHQYIIMPDHVHVLVQVLRHTKKAFGYYVGNLTGGITRAWSKTMADAPSVFEQGFNDRIIYPDRSLQVIYDYIRDNPYRLAIRRSNPVFFIRRAEVDICGVSCSIYGNVHLLDNPFKCQVVVHRADSPEERERKLDGWLHLAANGGVLVSPFISPDEKAAYASALAEGGAVILVSNRPIDSRYKPSGVEFDLCAEGRLLIVSPHALQGTPTLTRAACMQMNALAAAICR